MAAEEGRPSLNDNDNMFYLIIINNAHKRNTIFWINTLQLGLETIIKTKCFDAIIIATNRRIIKVISNINSLHRGLANKQSD